MYTNKYHKTGPKEQTCRDDFEVRWEINPKERKTMRNRVVYPERSAKSKRTTWNKERQSNAITNREGYHERRTTKSKTVKGITNG
jgi:hypothetical protein